MSIFNKVATPVKVLRSFFFLMALISAVIYFPPIVGYAQESDGLSEQAGDSLDVAETEEQAGESTDIPVEEEKIIFSKNIYHQHTGGSGGGGCYSVKRTGSKTTTEKCSGTMVYYASYDKTQCNKCGAGYNGDQSGRNCWHEKTKTESYTYYDLGCNKGTDTRVGSFTVEKSTEKWVKSLTLTGSYNADGGMSVSAQPYIWNGAGATENNTYEVNENGVYTLQINADANAAPAVLSVEVRNIDVTAPVIAAHSLEPSSDWTRDGVLVAITNVADLQPDGSEGGGLHEMPYSYDGGESWTGENTFLYMENGTHSILVRDILDNQSTYEVSLHNVDCFEPTIESVEYDDTKNIRETVLTITAKDVQPDGSEGSGLHKEAYSYDGGQTWTQDNTLIIDRNGTIHIVVRDALGNEAHMEKVISNIDCTGPEISWKLEPESWTNRNVKLTLKARDLNEDGSDGIGLESAWYSLDGGRTWSDKEKQEYDKNQTITVIARDKNNNRTSETIKIKQIDKELPWVTLSMEVIGAGRDMQVKLTAQAWDDYSGLPDKAYSWDKGVTYGTDSTKMVTENGSYQITVRDKAGNWCYDIVEVDVFPAIEIPVIVKKKMEPETTVESTVVMEETEEETQTFVVKEEKRIEAPKPEVVQTIEEGLDWKDAVVVISLILLLAGMAVFLLMLLLQTIAIYAENLDGKMQYMGRLWIQERDGRFEVNVSFLLLEKCVTTHFCFRLSPLFVLFNKKKDICFLFPEDICLIKETEREIEISLL